MPVSNEIHQQNQGNAGNPANQRSAGSTLGWRELAVQRPTLAERRRKRILGITSVLLLLVIIFAGIRLTAVLTTTNDQVIVHIGNQQVVTLDLRQSLPINADILGTNIFPQIGTASLDDSNGIMDYSPPLTSGLVNAHVKLLDFPGGNWGEQHYLSRTQLASFATLLNQIHADGLIQTRLSGPIKNNFTELTDLPTRVGVAASWVDFMNNPHSDQRIAQFAHAPFHAVKYWTVGNEPDKLINPATGHLYTVAEYVHDFIQYSIAMHRADPTIKIFGPEISEFYGPGAGPTDANGQLWMEGFLKGVGAYERAHNVTLLDGVSFHRFQFTDATQTPYLFLSSTGEWNYLLPALHQIISQNLQHDLPIAITGINTNSANQAPPSRGLAALWWADTLGTLMNQRVAYISFSSASGIDQPYPLFTTSGQQPTPMLRVMDIFSHLQRNLIPLEIQHDPISTYATQDDKHQTVSLLFVNKSATGQLVQFSSDSNLFVVSPWSGLNVNIPGYSMVVVTLHRYGGAEAYSFGVPTSSDTGTAAVIHTECGKSTSTVANATIC